MRARGYDVCCKERALSEEDVVMSEPTGRPQGDPARRGQPPDDLDHPQAQATQLPGGGGAPETGCEPQPEAEEPAGVGG
jgi:hypothetical protein